jgi:DNA invertase Pin-like site-specific DNA recombinase
MARRMAKAIKLTVEERDALERRMRRLKIARAEALGAEIVLRAADGESNCAIADAVGVTRQTVRTWYSICAL